MNFSNYVAIFLAFCICLVTPLFVRNMYSSNTEITNEVVADYMVSAVKDAVSAASIEEDTAFSTSVKRSRAIAAFYESLYGSFGEGLTASQKATVNGYIPCIVLVDNNGMYINYKGSKEDDGTYLTTPLYSFTKTFEVDDKYYMFAFSIDGPMTIYDNEGLKIIEGTYSDICEQLNNSVYANHAGPIKNIKVLNSDGDEVSLFDGNNYEAYCSEKQSVITDTVIKNTEYYINSMNQSGENTSGKTYGINIPVTDGWRRKLEGPTVIAFFQGTQTPSYFNTTTNIYAVTGGELTKADKYYIKGGILEIKDGDEVIEQPIKYYHTSGCSELTDFNPNRTYYSMEECAKLGAYPCTECIP